MMKKLALSILLIAVFVSFASIANARTPDAFKWNSFAPANIAWETTNAWIPTDLAYTGKWPEIAGDIALFMPPQSQTQSLGAFQIWQTSDKTIADLIISVSNTFVCAEDNSPFLTFDSPSSDISTIAFTNAGVIKPDGSIQDISLQLSGTLKINLSNDLVIAGITPANPSNAVGWTTFNLYDSVNVFGNGHKIDLIGNGWFQPGYYGNSVKIWSDVSKVTCHGGVMYMWSGNSFDAPLHVYSYYDCGNNYNRGTIAVAGNNFDLDLVLSNAYLNTYYSGDGTVSWLKRYFSGTFVVREFILMDLPDTTGGSDLMWTNVIQSTVSGDGMFYKGYNDDLSGYVEFTGEIAPGENGNGSLHFYSPMGDKVYFGLPTDRLDLTMDINGMRDWEGVDNDIIFADNISGIDLGNIDLTVNVAADALTNPYRTNLLMYSFDNAFGGGFNSVTWSDPTRAGELIVTPQSISVIGIPPLSNSFDVFADRVMLVKGETQQVLIARSPFEMDVNAVADESWITVQPVISLSTDASVPVTVNVPADQPTTNGFGLSVGTIRFSAALNSNVFIDEDVFVLEPGYFELDESKIWLMNDQEVTESVKTFSPLTVGVSASIPVGAGWITVNPSSASTVYLTNSGKYIYFDFATQPAGTTGLISFVNIDTPTVQHDVPVEVVEQGYFETSVETLYFVTGETQKYFDISAPFKSDVNISSTDSWVAVTTSVSLNRNGYSVPVMIPADQPDGSVGTILLDGGCFSTVSKTISVEVIPEPFAIVTLLLAAGALAFRRLS